MLLRRGNWVSRCVRLGHAPRIGPQLVRVTAPSTTHGVGNVLHGCSEGAVEHLEGKPKLVSVDCQRWLDPDYVAVEATHTNEQALFTSGGLDPGCQPGSRLVRRRISD